MRYLPILDELFSSDTVTILAIGLIIGLVFSLMLKETKKKIYGLIGSLVIYLVCELVCDLSSSYAVGMGFLFLGTYALGTSLGFLLGIIVSKIRKK